MIGAFCFCNSLTSVTFQGTIASLDYEAFGSPWESSGYIGDLYDKYYVGGIGTYKRPNSSSKTWTKQ